MSSLSSLEWILLIFLVAGALIDLREQRIPNAITVTAIVVGILIHFYLNGFQGAAFALGGFVVGMIFLLPFYILGGMGAGDVKLMGAAGAFLGPHSAILAVGATLIFGAVCAVGVLIGSAIHSHRVLKLDIASNSIKGMARASEQTDRPTQINNILKRRFPYALAIVAGSMTAMIL
jgi:prepilin peptidase CpaA